LCIDTLKHSYVAPSILPQKAPVEILSYAIYQGILVPSKSKKERASSSLASRSTFMHPAAESSIAMLGTWGAFSAIQELMVAPISVLPTHPVVI
jgi:hypothetical protein